MTRQGRLFIIIIKEIYELILDQFSNDLSEWNDRVSYIINMFNIKFTNTTIFVRFLKALPYWCRIFIIIT